MLYKRLCLKCSRWILQWLSLRSYYRFKDSAPILPTLLREKKKVRHAEWSWLLGTLLLLCGSLWSQKSLRICQHNRGSAETLIFGYILGPWCGHLDSTTFVLDVLSCLECLPHFRKAPCLHRYLYQLWSQSLCCMSSRSWRVLHIL